MKKSLYIFLSSLVGAFLFLILHRLLIFAVLVLSVYNANFFNFNISYVEFAALDYSTLIIAVLLGLWYGDWLGLYWHEQVYEKESHRGFVDHLTTNYWPRRNSSGHLKSRLMSASRKLEEEMWELEELAKEVPEKNPLPIKRRVIRTRYPKRVE